MTFKLEENWFDLAPATRDDLIKPDGPHERQVNGTRQL